MCVVSFFLLSPFWFWFAAPPECKSSKVVTERIALDSSYLTRLFVLFFDSLPFLDGGNWVEESLPTYVPAKRALLQ